MPLPGESHPVEEFDTPTEVLEPVNGVEPAPEIMASAETVNLEHLAAADRTLEAWGASFEAARKLGNTVLKEFTARDRAAKAGDPEFNDEGIGMASDAELRRNALRPSTSIVGIEKNELGRSPSSWFKRYRSYAAETPLKFGWTLAENAIPAEGFHPRGNNAGSRGGLLSEIDEYRATAGQAGDSKNDGAIVDDPNTMVERVVVTNGTKNALILVRGTRAELDKGGLLTRIPNITAQDEKTRTKLEEYTERNDFSNVEVSVITPEKLATGELDLQDPVAMGHAVVSGLRRLMTSVMTDSLTLKD